MVNRPDVQGWLVIVDPNRYYLPDPNSNVSQNPLSSQNQGSGDVTTQPQQSRTSDRIQFTYLQDTFSESKSANYSSTAVLGRSEPIRGYLGSTPRTLSLTLTVPPEGDDAPIMNAPGQGSPVSNSSISLVPIAPSFSRKQEILDFIRATVYPAYSQGSDGIVYPPPRVMVIFGTWFQMIGIVTSWNMVHKRPYSTDDLMCPFYTDISLTIEECDQPYSFSDVYSGRLSGSGVPSVFPNIT